MAKPISVMVIEDNRLLRDGLTALLNAQEDFQVAASVDDGDAGLACLQETKPQVVLVDAFLGSHDCRQLIEAITRAAPATRVVVMDLLPVQEDFGAFIKAGASGFIVKDATVDDLVATIRLVAGGVDFVPRARAGTLLSLVAEHAVVRRTPALVGAMRMTARELEITTLIAEGLSNKEIAQRLNIATYTVKSHVHNILEKLALHTRLEIAAHAHRGGDPRLTAPDP
jgi:two-component system, NarL family, nitrate/nitrite response regulator NarL